MINPLVFNQSILVKRMERNPRNKELPNLKKQFNALERVVYLKEHDYFRHDEETEARIEELEDNTDKEITELRNQVETLTNKVDILTDMVTHLSEQLNFFVNPQLIAVIDNQVERQMSEGLVWEDLYPNSLPTPTFDQEPTWQPMSIEQEEQQPVQ